MRDARYLSMAIVIVLFILIFLHLYTLWLIVFYVSVYLHLSTSAYLCISESSRYLCITIVLIVHWKYSKSTKWLMHDCAAYYTVYWATFVWGEHITSITPVPVRLITMWVNGLWRHYIVLGSNSNGMVLTSENKRNSTLGWHSWITELAGIFICDIYSLQSCRWPRDP